MEKLTDCSFCKRPLDKHWDQPAFSKCHGCGILLQNPFPDPEDLEALYQSSWERPEENTDETGNADLELARQYAKALASSLNREDFSDLTILEYGAGKGALMHALQEQGADVHGIEPYGIERLKDQGLKAYASVSEVPEEIRFDGVVSMQVVEHLRQPWLDLEMLRRSIVPGGWMCVCTPNPRGLRARLQGANWREAAKPGHILLLEERTLVSILHHAGFCRIRRLRWQIKFGRSFLGSVLQFLLQAFLLDGDLRVLAWERDMASRK